MIHLRNRTEYSFKAAFGKLKDVVSVNQGTAAGICDRGGTWGHVQWAKACKAEGIKPIFGVELAVVKDMDERDRQPVNYMAFLAKSAAGLREIYELVTLASEKFYYEPRIDYSVVQDATDEIVILSGVRPDWSRLPVRDNLYIELAPTSLATARKFARERNFKVVATGDNIYCRAEDKYPYDIIAGRAAESRSSAQHIISRAEWDLCWQDDDAVANAAAIAEMCNVELPTAQMVKPDRPATLRAMCESGAPARNIDLANETYRARLDRELDLIAQKEFEDYFYVVADICKFAKSTMLVGPARGSSCGSLVCYLLGITDIDPLPYNLLFERFIDINRDDLPDIDIDFPDNRREEVFEYIRKKYGFHNVARLGTVNMFKPRSAVQDVGKALNIPPWVLLPFKNSLFERADADERANLCINDAFIVSDVGRTTLVKHPELRVATALEGHAKHSGQHACGILVTANPVSWFCGVDVQTGAAQVDKKDAETLNLLKIDILGIRTLSVIQDTLEQIGWSRDRLLAHPTDDAEALAVLNKRRFAGIFQFEGDALQGVCKQIRVDDFEDMVSMTAISRPGPLASGGADQFIRRKNGEAVQYRHPLLEPITNITYGIIVYQEQVMRVAREIGGLSWPDVSKMRKAISRTEGLEAMEKFKVAFLAGAARKGVEEAVADEIWSNINTMGGYAFNRSHAVAYGLISYWCCVLKAHAPLEFAAACLRHPKDDGHPLAILREFSASGYKFLPFDRDLSGLNWTIHGKTSLVGGLTGIKGVGLKTAQDIVARRDKGIPLTDRQEDILRNGTTPYDIIFETHRLWGHIFKNPAAYNIQSELVSLGQIQEGKAGQRVFIAKLMTITKRDHNEPQLLLRRGTRMTPPTTFLNLTLADDTGEIIVVIDRNDYERIGKPIVEGQPLGDWFIFKAQQQADFHRLTVRRLWRLSGETKFQNPEQRIGGDFKNGHTESANVSRAATKSQPAQNQQTGLFQFPGDN